MKAIQTALRSTNLFSYGYPFDFNRTAMARAFTVDQCVLDGELSSGTCELSGKNLIIRMKEKDVRFNHSRL